MRAENEMQITLRTLRNSFGVDVARAAGLHGQELADWLDQAEDAVFEREHAELIATLQLSLPRTHRPL